MRRIMPALRLARLEEVLGKFLESAWVFLGKPEMVSNKDQPRRIYEFGPFCVDEGERILLRDGEPMTLAPKLFETLLILAKNSGHIVEKRELMEAVWPETFVEESNLAANVSLLRKLLGAREDGKPYIETVPRRGYRFSAEVTELEDGGQEWLLRRRTRTRIIATEEEEPPRTALALSAAQPTSSISQRKRGFVLAMAAVVLVTVGVIAGLKYFGREASLTGPFARMKVTRLTASGKASYAAISPDGKYTAQVIGDSGQQSLWLRHIATGSDQEIVPSNGNDYNWVTFSPDGGHILFGRIDAGAYPAFQVPVLGGTPKKLMSEDADTPVSFSPDGKRFAFMRGAPQHGEVFLIVSNADGTNEQKLVTHKLNDFTGAWPAAAWSPDGGTIVFGHLTTGAGARHMNVIAVRVSDGLEKEVTRQQWSAIRALAWLPDGRGIVVTAADAESAPSLQIWHVAYPGGEVRRITNDTNNYRGISLTADATALVTTKSEQVSNIWSTQSGDAARVTQLTSSRNEGAQGLAWAPDGRIVYTSSASARRDLWIMNADGTTPQQLTADASNTLPSVSPDGRHIIFSSERAGAMTIWRIDIDGGNPKRLTSGNRDFGATFSPDGRWLVYTATESEKQILRKLPVDGGDSVRLTDFTSGNPRVSPDGKLIVCGYVNEQEKPLRWRVALISSDGGPPIKIFDIQAVLQRFMWAHDGRAILYTLARDGVTNVWSQPIDGSAATQITDFKTDLIFRFDRTADGKQFVMARGSITRDAIMITDVK